MTLYGISLSYFEYICPHNEEKPTKLHNLYSVGRNQQR